jgi:drug/metabolite transporter (DMT)-like permease
MLCFAANSLLCRLALAANRIDAASFTTLRVLSAAIMLSLVVWPTQGRVPRLRYANLRSVAALFVYLIFFSFAYARLSAGAGALLLIGAVELTMFIIAFNEGERFSRGSWIGLSIAILGFLYLVLPGVSAPDPLGAVLMAASGVAWGFFSLLARGTDHPVEANASNFLCCLPPALLANLVGLQDCKATAMGIGLAAASGAIASGLGYIAWYLALRELPATSAAVIQLSMPVLVALGGVALLAEPLTMRLLLSSTALLGGIAVVMAQRVQRE